VELTNKVLFGTSVVVVVNGIDAIVGFVIKFVIDVGTNVDAVIFKSLTVLAVVMFSNIIVSFFPFLRVVITGLENFIFLTVSFKNVFLAVVVTVVFVAVAAVFKYNLVIFSIETTVN